MDEFTDLLRCPISGERLAIKGNKLVSSSGNYTYNIDQEGILLFADDPARLNQDAIDQQNHYDKVYQQYVENINYPHTEAYNEYLDEKFTDELQNDVGVSAEICCGHGEIPRLLDKMRLCIGVDISHKMLKIAKKRFPVDSYILAQGDAINLPLESNKFDSVFMLGGIHHVNDRDKLFSEVNRILKPGGAFYFREPVSDFVLWKIIRSVIYYLSPGLDHKTERPLVYEETIPVLLDQGFSIKKYKHIGFIGFCIFMNSDILIFNRLFRFVPGIKKVVRISSKIDDFFLSIPWFKTMGLQVVGVAVKDPK